MPFRVYDRNGNHTHTIREVVKPSPYGGLILFVMFIVTVPFVFEVVWMVVRDLVPAIPWESVAFMGAGTALWIVLYRYKNRSNNQLIRVAWILTSLFMGIMWLSTVLLTVVMMFSVLL